MKGFTLLETLIATLVLSIALIALSSSWSGGLLAVRKSRAMTTVSYLLQQKITEYELKYEGKAFEEMKEEDSGDFGPDYPSFRWSVKVQKMPAPDLTVLGKDKDGRIDETTSQVLKQMTEYLKKACVEMKVSIFWKVGKKEKEYSATTLLVNFDKDPDMGGG